jgi:hypothetical protein
VKVYRSMVLLVALGMIALGGAMIVVTLTHGGFGVGIILGLLFMGAGGGRVWMLRRRTVR